MRTTIPKKARVLLLASLLMIGISASADIIYDNSVTDKNLRFSPTPAGPTTEFGDEIIFAGSARSVTNFSFEYWAFSGPGNEVNPLNFSSTASARIRFYINNGVDFNGYAAPGTVLYDSGSLLFSSFGGGPTTRSTLIFSAGVDFPVGGLFIPTNRITWTVQFSGLDGNDSAGLDVFYPPAVGTSPAQQNNVPDDYWEFSGPGWALKTNIVDMSFAARFEAVPEPSAVVLGILGGLGLLVVGGRFMKRTK